MNFQILMGLRNQGVTVPSGTTQRNSYPMKLLCFGKPFCATKEMHVLMLQALIGVCLKLGSFVVNLATSINLYSLALLLLHSNFIFTLFFL
jgi:hypothetical protein